MVYGRVYTIRSHQTPDIYIGSTIQALSMRMCGHRSDYKRYLDKQMNYVSSFEILKYDDAYIEVLFEEDFESKDALYKKEGQYIREMQCVNKHIAGRTDQEWRKDNEEIIKKKQHAKYEKKKDIYCQKSREYHADHKEECNNRSSQYYADHKEELSAIRNKKIMCGCGFEYTHINRIRHEKSKRHQYYLNV